MVKECLWEEKKYNSSSSSSWLFMLGQLFRDSSPDNRRDLSGIPSRLQNGTSGSVLSIESNLIIERALSKIWLWKEKSWVCGIESGHKVTLVQNLRSYFRSINRTIFHYFQLKLWQNQIQWSATNFHVCINDGAARIFPATLCRGRESNPRQSSRTSLRGLLRQL